MLFASTSQQKRRNYGETRPVFVNKQENSTKKYKNQTKHTKIADRHWPQPLTVHVSWLRGKSPAHGRGVRARPLSGEAIEKKTHAGLMKLQENRKEQLKLKLKGSKNYSG